MLKLSRLCGWGVQVQASLAAITERMQLLVKQYRAECSAVGTACQRSHAASENARRQLRIAFLVHQEACR